MSFSEEAALFAYGEKACGMLEGVKGGGGKLKTPDRLSGVLVIISLNASYDRIRNGLLLIFFLFGGISCQKLFLYFLWYFFIAVKCNGEASAPLC